MHRVRRQGDPGWVSRRFDLDRAFPGLPSPFSPQIQDGVDGGSAAWLPDDRSPDDVEIPQRRDREISRVDIVPGLETETRDLGDGRSSGRPVALGRL
jgi:hypothetical protein